jgi:hypothetical protein
MVVQWDICSLGSHKFGEGPRLASHARTDVDQPPPSKSIITRYSTVYVQCVEGRNNPNQLVQTPCLRFVAVQNACSRFEAGDHKVPTECRLTARDLLHSCSGQWGLPCNYRKNSYFETQIFINQPLVWAREPPKQWWAGVSWACTLRACMSWACIS